MAWWKFWTWFRRDQVSQYVTKAPRKVRSPRPVAPRAAGPDEPEDILGSISELIEGHSPDPADFVQPARMVEPVPAMEEIPALEPITTAQAVDLIQKTSKPFEQLEQAGLVVPELAEQPRPAKPVREPAGSKRDESRNDARQTLVADDILRALSERFKDFDPSKDDDDRNGPSPYQTIVPNDD